MYSKLASAIYNDLVSGLRGYAQNITISMEQLEDEIIETRLLLIKQYTLKGIIPRKDLMMAINCIPVDCKSMDNCPCDATPDANLVAHFEIPQLVNDYGVDAIEYIGSIDKQNPFLVYTDMKQWRMHKYRKRGKTRPFVFIETTPNENNMYDGWIFNAPLLKQISIVGIFKDLRQLKIYGCCNLDEEIENFSFLNAEIKNHILQHKVHYYRQLATPIQPNDQVPK